MKLGVQQSQVDIEPNYKLSIFDGEYNNNGAVQVVFHNVGWFQVLQG
jgi:hypothetical protein